MPNPVTTVIVGTGQKEIHDLLALIRPEFSHLAKRHGKTESILKRLATKFERVDALIEWHTPERLGVATMEAVEKERMRYQQVLEQLKIKVA